MLRPLHAAAARQHDLGLGQLGEPRGDLFAPLDEFHLRGGGRPRRTLDSRLPAGFPVGRAEDVRPERRDPGCLRPRDLGQELARVHGARRDEALAVHGERHTVGGEPDAEPRGEPRGELTRAARDRRKDGPRPLLGRELGRGAHPDLAPVRRERSVLQEPDLRRAPLGELRQARLARLVGEPHGLGPATRDARGLADDLGHHLLRRPPPVILDDAPERVRHGPRPSDRLGFFA